MRRAFRAGSQRVHRVAPIVDDIIVKGVLHVRLRIHAFEKAREIRFVFGEQQRRILVQQPSEIAQRNVRRFHAVGPEHAEQRLLGAGIPCPSVPEPQRRQHMQARLTGPAIRHRDADENLLRSRLRVFDRHVEVTPIAEYSRVGEFKFAILRRAASVFLAQSRVRKLRLRILVQRAHVGRRRGRIKIPVALLHVLAMRPLAVCQAKEALLQNRIAPIPKRERKAEPRLPVADPHQSILAPPVRPRARMLERKIAPRIAIRRIILPHRAPLPLAHVRTPSLPVRLTARFLLQPSVFRGGS